ncbi:hypothetical protein SAMN03159304_05821 [Pseudomonas sp. NFACC24-1]|uniref:hypothetical protein n=1 Tax=Pseudomonas sp. NFACC24-1 TaxID=1566189 RepID=UPI0008E4B289|nr:hypothetical protein [Pseudomonas sp. NFACC24-1]SFP02817.1 hypothetical protein SAMN03159304_05821 [Pseudomonas sp. NFACC24-1]
MSFSPRAGSVFGFENSLLCALTKIDLSMRVSFFPMASVWLTYGLALSGCSLVEPHSRTSWETDSRVSAQEVISCAQKTVQELSVKNPKWDTTITRSEDHNGTLETGNYPDTNATELRTRVTFQPETHQLAVDIKASGPYYMDLGAKEGANHFRRDIENCLTIIQNICAETFIVPYSPTFRE